MSSPAQPPRPRREPVARELHGETVVDEYAWMREREDPAVLAHLEAENAYTEAVLTPLAAFRERLFEEIRARIQETDLSVPDRKGPWWYLSRTEEGRQYAIACRRSDADEGPDLGEESGQKAREEVLLDCNELAGESEYFALGAYEVSPDHETLAYSVDFSGAELYEMRFRDLRTGHDLPDAIEGTYYGTAWARDGSALFYVRPDEAMRPYQLWRHELGTPAEADQLLFQEDDERFFLDVDASRSEEWVVLTLQSQTTTEVWILDARAHAADARDGLRCVRPREDGVEYWVEHIRGAAPGEPGQLAILATLDAPNGRVLTAPVEDPGRWSERVPHRGDVKLDGLDAFAEHLVLWCRKQGMSSIEVLPAGHAESEPVELAFPEPVRHVDAGSNLEYETSVLRFEYQSLVTPSSVYDHDLHTGERTLKKRQPVLGAYEPDAYESIREWATAADGTRVPISLVVPKGAARDGSMPLVLYGYGAYEANTDPWFSAARLSLLERGVGFAIAHVRGGGELGRHWYDEGKLAAKANSFHDFVACAEHLVARGYTAPERLAARGGSAGGLLVAAVANLQPELFRAVVAEVPFVDVVNTMLDASLPLTVTEWEEWGDPRDPAQYAWLRAYAPYENVGPHPYPRMLVTAGLNDPRVQYWEPAKWVARLRERGTGREPILLKTEMGAGHGGPSGRYDAWRDEALVLAFLLDAFDRAG